MDVSSGRKLKNLLETMRPHSVVTSAMLTGLGISPSLVQEYVKNGWLTRLGKGALHRTNEIPKLSGAVHSLQNQLGLPIHVAAMSALESDGVSHYLRMGRVTMFLFSPPKVSLPAWFRNYDWFADISHTQTKLLPSDLGVRDQTFSGFTLKASAPERAILECLHLAPATIDLDECYQVMGGLLNLRPTLMQSLLEACNSIKVKRLFLFMADKANLPVMKHLDQTAIDLGSGIRPVVQDGAYDSRYRLMLPKGLVGNG
jgi:hypothetical protein